MSQLILRNWSRYPSNKFAKAVCNAARSLKDQYLLEIADGSQHKPALFRYLTSSVCSWLSNQHYSNVSTYDTSISSIQINDFDGRISGEKISLIAVFKLIN